MAKTSYRTGESGFATLNVDTEGKVANAFEAIITYDPSLVEITGLSSDKLIINAWVQSATIDNVNGRLAFKGVSLNPAFNGNPGRLIGFDFKAKAPGKFNFNVSNFTVLANDGQGTKLSTKPVPRDITITGSAQTNSGVIISSSTHSDQKKWYNKQTASIFWKASEKDIIDFAYGFNKNPKAELPTSSTTQATSIIQRDITDGTWYAHVRAQYKTKGWLSTEHFKINIDTKAPEKLIVTVAPRLNESILPTIRISAKDNLSGISAYEVLANGKSLTKANVLSSYKLKNLVVGKNTIEVVATDNAGNSARSKLSVLYNPLSKNKPTVTPQTPSLPKTQEPTVKPQLENKPKVNTPILFD